MHKFPFMGFLCIWDFGRTPWWGRSPRSTWSMHVWGPNHGGGGEGERGQGWRLGCLLQGHVAAAGLCSQYSPILSSFFSIINIRTDQTLIFFAISITITIHWKVGVSADVEIGEKIDQRASWNSSLGVRSFKMYCSWCPFMIQHLEYWIFHLSPSNGPD